MQEFMSTYRSNIDEIENFLIETVRNTGQISLIEKNNFEKLFSAFPSLELIYICDKESLLQTSPNIYRDNSTQSQIGQSRKYLLNKIHFNENGVSVSQPYISSATGRACVTIAKLEQNKIYFLDFDVTMLLQRLGLIEIHKEFDTITKGFYLIASVVMMLLALFTMGYAIYEFFDSTFIKVNTSIESIFKPVIALTLGLAIFDLGKTVLEQEVVFKSYSKNSNNVYRVLIKFSITIIIALLIESLMVVFKIAIDNYSQMIHAFYLISGVSVLILSLSVFIYLSKRK